MIGKNNFIEFKVLVKIPSKWVDFESPFGGLSFTIREELDKLLNKKVVDEVIKKVKLPEIKVTQKEVKDRMLDILAKKALQTPKEDDGE